MFCSSCFTYEVRMSYVHILRNPPVIILNFSENTWCYSPHDGFENVYIFLFLGKYVSPYPQNL